MLKRSYSQHPDKRNLSHPIPKTQTAPEAARYSNNTQELKDLLCGPGINGTAFRAEQTIVIPQADGRARDPDSCRSTDLNDTRQKPFSRQWSDVCSGERTGGTAKAAVIAPAVDLFTRKAVVDVFAARQLALLETLDRATFLHSLSVARLMVQLARACELDDKTSHEIHLGGLLHDIGKMRIPTELINKADPLTDGEMALIRLHPMFGYDLLAKEDCVSNIVLDICLHHHERLDGSGYPDGLTGENISMAVRISSICDVYDALTADRPYKKALPASEARQLMMKQSRQFDIDLLTVFFDMMSKSEDVG